MTVWDVSPGYLSDRLLLEEYLEIRSALNPGEGQKRQLWNLYDRKRWQDHKKALYIRLSSVAHEIRLRGIFFESPVQEVIQGPASWPGEYILPPRKQLFKIKQLLGPEDPGRIPIPENTQQLWSHHKYSVMARSPQRYKEIGPAVARSRASVLDEKLCLEFCEWLRVPPPLPRLINAVEHMWGHVSRFFPPDSQIPDPTNPKIMLQKTIELAGKHKEAYLLHSTALGELFVWINN